MSDKKSTIDVFNAHRLPATLRAEETAALLGRSSHDLPILAATGILKPLNAADASPNAVKYYATTEVLALCADVKALQKMTREVARFWARKNSRGNLRNGTDHEAP